MTASAKSPGLKIRFVPISKFTNNSQNRSKGLYGSLISKASPGYLCPLSTAKTPRATLTLPYAMRALYITHCQKRSLSPGGVQLQHILASYGYCKDQILSGFHSLTFSNTWRFTQEDLQITPEVPVYMCPPSHTAGEGGGEPGALAHRSTPASCTQLAMCMEGWLSHSGLWSWSPDGESQYK